jgi:subtilisin family serine protease
MPNISLLPAGRIETIRLGKGDLPESARQHGTAVAALLVGSAESRTPGLLPGGELVAVDAFQRNGNDDRSAVYDLVRAIDLLAGKGVLVINMSLTGPANLLLERTVEMATQREIVLVAAAGNGGPRAAPLYPGAYGEVIAVTAIDRRKNAYRRAGAGDHIDIAAPGVQVWTAASVKGASSKTGTSFAAPFVTAAAAMIKAANPQLKADEVEALLRQGAEDLGKPGKDPVFGWGLLNARTICQS